jgi:hypothetical protein
MASTNEQDDDDPKRIEALIIAIQIIVTIFVFSCCCYLMCCSRCANVYNVTDNEDGSNIDANNSIFNPNVFVISFGGVDSQQIRIDSDTRYRQRVAERQRKKNREDPVVRRKRILHYFAERCHCRMVSFIVVRNKITKYNYY